MPRRYNRNNPPIVRGTERHRIAKNADQNALHEKLRASAVQYKGGRCVRCGGTYDPCVFDFHHRNPSAKIASISGNFLKSQTWETVTAELDKCDLLCANCHRMVELEKRKISYQIAASI